MKEKSWSRLERHVLPVVIAGVLLSLTACGNRMSQAEMQRKLDSIAKLEGAERLAAQGIRVGENASPLRLFFDSLNIQPLPIRYDEDYVKMLPNYKEVPLEFVTLLNLEGRHAPKAIALPETVGTKLMILAADEGDGLYSLWLYSLDSELMPVDKLCLYADSKEDEEENKIALPEDQLIQDFVITSDYEICLTDYSGKFKAEVQRVYHIDPSRQFVEDKEIDYEELDEKTATE
ncbi:MAG: hypothetical protein K5764_03295 [Prevotella sp.]|nr:hypothetical protein [Prevotella sp.]